MKVRLIQKIVAGSHLYGTATEDSDIDYRGVVLQPVKSILGLQRFEQVERGGDQDLVYYGVDKFFRLALAGNPNILDILCAPPDTWLVESGIWNKIYAMRSAFLSQRVRKTFLGYATSQLKRIRTHVRWMDDPPEEPTAEGFGLRLISGLHGAQSYVLSDIPPVDDKIKAVTVATIQKTLAETPNMQEIRESVVLIGKAAQYEQQHKARVKAYKAARREWRQYQTWLRNRNPARFALEREYGYDVKHAAHLFRLLIKVGDILKYGDYDPRLSPAQLVIVKAVLIGQLSYESMLLRQEKMADFIKGIDSPLPEEPDAEAVEQQLMEINMMTVGLSWAGEEIPAELATVEEV